MAATQAASGSGATLSHYHAVWAVVVVGLVLVVLADYIPHLVNGVLLLILAGIILQNSPRWLPMVDAIASGFALVAA